MQHAVVEHCHNFLLFHPFQTIKKSIVVKSSSFFSFTILSPLRLLLPLISCSNNLRCTSQSIRSATATTILHCERNNHHHHHDNNTIRDNNNTNNMMNNVNDCLQVKFLSEHATLPRRGSPQSAGFDLSSAEKITVPSGGRAVVKTDLSIACPEGTYARIAPRSGLAVKHMIDCGAGVVDADYRGNVGVVLFNFGPSDFEINIGDRIAQLILEQISMVPAIQVEELTETVRGEGGFGSTGISSSSSLRSGNDTSEKIAQEGEGEETEEEQPMAKMQRVISPSNVAMSEE